MSSMQRFVSGDYQETQCEIGVLEWSENTTKNKVFEAKSLLREKEPIIGGQCRDSLFY